MFGGRRAVETNAYTVRSTISDKDQAVKGKEGLDPAGSRNGNSASPHVIVQHADQCLPRSTTVTGNSEWDRKKSCSLKYNIQSERFLVLIMRSGLSTVYVISGILFQMFHGSLDGGQARSLGVSSRG